jgi:pyridoxal phosphate enzyme (YggS family)
MSATLEDLKRRWELVESRIRATCERAKRLRSEVRVLPVSKGHSEALILESFSLYPRPHALGENYLDEMKKKALALQETGLKWHYLGRLQSRKIEEICEIADCVHTVSRVKEFEMLSDQNGVPSFYVQMNISDEDQKNGCDEAGLVKILESIEKRKLGDKFLGLMGMASPLEEALERGVRQQFSKLRNLRDRLVPGKELNMGMSGDFEIAIEEGSNLVRIGSLLFGDRPKQ